MDDSASSHSDDSASYDDYSSGADSDMYTKSSDRSLSEPDEHSDEEEGDKARSKTVFDIIAGHSSEDDSEEDSEDDSSDESGEEEEDEIPKILPKKKLKVRVLEDVYF